MKVLDLFSGIGGFSLGLERAGHKTIAFCEKDESCRKVLKKHWPGVPIIEDIRNLKGQFIKKFYGRPDIVCGGFPCQNISVAGDKKGIDGKKSGLWRELKRIIKETRPRWAIIENVANLRNKGLGQVIKDLWEIGYCCEWHIIPAYAVGSPHLRERIFIIAYPNSKGIPRLWKSWGKVPSLSKSKINGLLWHELRSGIEKGISKLQKERIEPKYQLCRMDNGLPRGVDKDRIKMLGNAILPQIAEIIGRVLR